MLYFQKPVPPLSKKTVHVVLSVAVSLIPVITTELQLALAVRLFSGVLCSRRTLQSASTRTNAVWRRVWVPRGCVEVVDTRNAWKSAWLKTPFTLAVTSSDDGTVPLIPHPSPARHLCHHSYQWVLSCRLSPTLSPCPSDPLQICMSGDYALLQTITDMDTEIRTRTAHILGEPANGDQLIHFYSPVSSLSVDQTLITLSFSPKTTQMSVSIMESVLPSKWTSFYLGSGSIEFQVMQI